MKQIIVILFLLLFPLYVFAQKDSLKKQPLGKSINTYFNELLPVISPDGKTLYFCRVGHPQNLGFEEDISDTDIWISYLGKDSSWSPAVNAGKPLNNKLNNFVCSITPDGNTILLGGYYDEFHLDKDKVYYSKKTKTGWSNPKPLNIKNFYNNHQFGVYYLCNDGKTLLMSVERRDSYGDLDIYVSFHIDGNMWTEPMNLGNTINTKYDDTTPFIASDGVTLYFASEGHKGYGEYDIFMSRRLDSTWKKWSVPVNLGEEINSDEWEAYYRLDAQGTYAYFVSYAGGNDADIYRVRLPEEIRPNPVVLVSGIITDAVTKEPVEADVLYEFLPDGTEAGIASSNPLTGEYKIVLPAGRNYGFHTEAEGYLSVSENIDATDVNIYTEITKNIELKKNIVGQIVRLNNVFFDFDKYDLKEESFPELDRVADFLNENPGVIIEISGHTDNIGSDEYNLVLSENRAKSVRDYLISKGIQEYRVTYKGYGESVPVDTNETDEGRQNNRRVEFKILSL